MHGETESYSIPSSTAEAGRHVLDDPVKGGYSQESTTSASTAAGPLHGLSPSS